MNSILQFYKDHGTKILGTLIAINSGLAAGSVVLPPPLNAHSAVIAQWAVFLNFILGVIVVQRGNANTNSIATAVVDQQKAQGLPVVTAAAIHEAAPAAQPPAVKP
jgi:hypothetical protein